MVELEKARVKSYEVLHTLVVRDLRPEVLHHCVYKYVVLLPDESALRLTCTHTLQELSHTFDVTFLHIVCQSLIIDGALTLLEEVCESIESHWVLLIYVGHYLG